MKPKFFMAYVLTLLLLVTLACTSSLPIASIDKNEGNVEWEIDYYAELENDIYTDILENNAGIKEVRINDKDYLVCETELSESKDFLRFVFTKFGKTTCKVKIVASVSYIASPLFLAEFTLDEHIKYHTSGDGKITGITFLKNVEVLVMERVQGKEFEFNLIIMKDSTIKWA